MHIDAVIKRFKEINNLSKHKELAKFLNISPQDFSQRKNRGTIINLILEHPSTKQINLHWLLTGEGPMQRENLQKAAAAAAGTSTKNYADILRMTAEIMESGTVYAEALKSNVIAFHRAVVREALPVMETAMEQRLKPIIEQELRVIKGSGGPPGEWPDGTSRKDKAVTDEPPEGPELGKMGM